MRYFVVFGFILYCCYNTERIIPCWTEEHFQRQLSELPTFRERVREIELFTEESIRTFELRRGLLGKQEYINLNIPIVFHVLYNNDKQNISLKQIESQINVLNKDFNALNSDIINIPNEFRSLVGNFSLTFYIDSIIRIKSPSPHQLRLILNFYIF